MTKSVYPELNGRALGWLKFLWDKATTSDDWSLDGRPHEWWDDRSNFPSENYARFDLNKSIYAVGIMADATPAWREGYTRILSELIARHTTYWASIDWITQIGMDPDRNNYSEAIKVRFIPPGLQGRYNTAGWTADGIEPWGLQPDPIACSGNVFFRGNFLKMLAVYSKVSGDDNGPGVLKGLSIRLDVLNVFDKVYLIRDGQGVGVGAPQFGARRGFLAGITKIF